MNRNQGHAPGSDPGDDAPSRKGRFRPSKAPIDPKAPSRQNVKVTGPKFNKNNKDPDLKPKNLSTTSSELKNDPLDLNAVSIVGLAGLAFSRRLLKYRLDFSGYFDLIEAEYAFLCSTYKPFQKRVSLTMFTVYCEALLYYRIWEHLNFTNRDPEDNFGDLQRALPKNPAITRSIHAYLDAIASVKDPNSRTWLIDIYDFEPNEHHGIAGFYGRVDQNTFYKYQTQSAPGVSYYRIFADLAKTDDDAYDANWNLPADVRCATNGSLPNCNLLGWRKAISLPGDTTRLLNQIGFDVVVDNATHEITAFAHPAESVIANMTVCPELLNSISEIISSTIKDHVSSYPASVYGSQALLGYIVNDDWPTAAGTVVQRSSLSELYGVSYTQLVPNRATWIAIGRFRRRRDNQDGDYCYKFTANNARPNNWAAARNIPFEHGDARLINQDIFQLATINGLEVSRSAAAQLNGR
jgi:hypothetical protein